MELYEKPVMTMQDDEEENYFHDSENGQIDEGL